MKNVKDQVYAALLTVSDNVSDSYPASWPSYPVIQYTEENNSVYEWSDNQEQKALVRYKVDIWHNKSTSGTALAVDQAIAALGLHRTACMDTPDPSGLKHKVMRYEGIIDMESDFVFWND